MTPKEKAKELVSYFRKLARISGGSGTSIEASKQCALKCVDEMINEWKGVGYPSSIQFISYWQEVKKEIETLEL